MAFHWGVQRAVGKGGQGRLESRPQARKPAPHQGGQECQRHTRRLLVSRGGKSSQADHRQDCRCGTQDCVLHAEAGMASLAACSTGGGGFSRAWKGTEIGGEGADTLVRPYRARHWVVQRAVGKGGQSRLEGRPQARKPAPHECRPTPKVIAPQQRSQRPLKPTTGKTAGVARKTACSTQRPAWQAWRHAPRRGRWGKPGGGHIGPPLHDRALS